MSENKISKATIDLIKDLTETQSISGNEGRIREKLKEYMAPLVDELDIFGLGNIYGRRLSVVEEAPTLMVAAHMDEVGFMVSQIHDNGTFSVVPIGGWNVYAVPAQRFTLQTKEGDYPVVSSSVSPHLLRGKKASELKVTDIHFDGGFSSKEEAESYGVRPGDAIVPDVETIMLANEKGMMGKAWDNRYGCAVMIETLQAIKEIDLKTNLVAGANVQEEVGLRGVKGAVYRYQPDVFLAVDCSPANDDSGDKQAMGRLGDGFLLRVQDPGMITHKGILEYLRDTATTHKIPYQIFFSKGGTDAGAAHLMNNGIPSGVIGVPGRYIHGHQTIFYFDDYLAARELLYQIVTTFDRTTLETIKEY